MPESTYTYEQVLQYEVANELCNTRIAECSGRMGEERAKAVPDEALIERIHAEMMAIGLERVDLPPLTDDAAVAASITHSQVELALQRVRYWGEAPG